MNVRIRDAVAYFRDSSVSAWHKLAGLAAIAYVVSPIDLVPDVLPLIGWLDDVGVIALIAGYYVRQISLYRSRQLKTPANATEQSSAIQPSQWADRTR
ncbi:MAG: DUF1232 domain-containing protein [Deltaproteobacteria bacterium]|nr:DUF1232 domain-containing protein [Deltaproteobacteria bacterium]